MGDCLVRRPAGRPAPCESFPRPRAAGPSPVLFLPSLLSVSLCGRPSVPPHPPPLRLSVKFSPLLSAPVRGPSRMPPRPKPSRRPRPRTPAPARLRTCAPPRAGAVGRRVLGDRRRSPTARRRVFRDLSQRPRHGPGESHPAYKMVSGAGPFPKPLPDRPRIVLKKLLDELGQWRPRRARSSCVAASTVRYGVGKNGDGSGGAER